jgi:hypothetical protein
MIDFSCTVTARGGSSGHDDSARVVSQATQSRPWRVCNARTGSQQNKCTGGGGAFPGSAENGGGCGWRYRYSRPAASLRRFKDCLSACQPVLSCPVCRHACAAPPLLVPRLVLVRVPSAALAAAAERRPLARRRRARGTALACACGGVRLGATIRVRVRVQVTMTLALTLPCGVQGLGLGPGSPKPKPSPSLGVR